METECQTALRKVQSVPTEEGAQVASVVFLKGLNVGGHRTFSPRLLASTMSELDVISIGAAGTFVVWKSIRQDELRREFLRRLPFRTEVMVCSAKDVLQLASASP